MSSVKTIHSTSSKAVASSATYTRLSIDNDLKRDVDLLNNEGISLEEMIKTLFEVEDEEYDTMKATFASWEIDKSEEFLAGKLELEKVLTMRDKHERHMYSPFVKMGNDVVQHAIEAYGPQANKIKLLFCGDKVLKSHFAERKPDVLLVPQYDGEYPAPPDVKGKGGCESESPGVEITHDNLFWWHVLLCLEFKKERSKESKSGQKRPLDSLTEQDNMEKPGPAKVSRPSASRSERPTRAGASTSSRRGSKRGRPIRSTGSGRERKVTSSSRTTSSVSREPRDPETQLASYAAEMLSANGDRIYALGLLVKDGKVYLRYYHQSCVVMSDGIDFLEDFTPLAILFMLYVKREVGRVGFGLNSVTGYINPSDTKSEKTMTMHCELVPVREDGVPFQLADNTDIHRKERVHTNYSLLGRGTAVHDIKVPGNTSKNLKLVVKSSWEVTNRISEHIFIVEARKIESKHVVQVFGQAAVADNSPSEQLREKCSRKSQEYEKKELRLLLERKYNPISEIDDPKIFWNVLMQCLRCAHKLYSKRNILHRDISINNLGYYIDDNGEYVGVLLNFDLASMEPTHVSARVRTGTAPFMAREVLDLSKTYTHRFHHELESFLYVTIWHALGYRPKKFPEPDILREWRKGSWKSIKDAKEFFILSKWFEIFPDPDPKEDYLRIRCGSLCNYFNLVGLNEKDSERSQRRNIYVDPDTGNPRSKMDYTTITFRRWLIHSWEPKDSEPCNKDCCV